MMRWGMPPQPRTGGPSVTNIRDTFQNTKTVSQLTISVEPIGLSCFEHGRSEFKRMSTPEWNVVPASIACIAAVVLIALAIEA